MYKTSTCLRANQEHNICTSIPDLYQLSSPISQCCRLLRLLGTVTNAQGINLKFWDHIMPSSNKKSKESGLWPSCRWAWFIVTNLQGLCLDLMGLPKPKGGLQARTECSFAIERSQAPERDHSQMFDLVLRTKHLSRAWRRHSGQLLCSDCPAHESLAATEWLFVVHMNDWSTQNSKHGDPKDVLDASVQDGRQLS